MTAAPWLQTRSGRAFPLVDPEPHHVYWPDIIFALSHINRFGGHVGSYTVAQHSVLVADDVAWPRGPGANRALCAEWRLYALLHDAHEAFVGDVPTPLKLFLGGNQRVGLGGLANAIDRAIYLAAGLVYPVPQEIAEAVHVVDRRVLVTERRDLMAEPPLSWGDEYDNVVPLPERIIRWSTEQSIQRFGAALAGAGLTIPAVSFIS